VGEWENYVFRTVEHYRERIRHWEVWNEPYWKGFFTGTPEEYAELLKVACRAIKRADPQAVVVGGCFTPSDEAWTRRLPAAAGLDFTASAQPAYSRGSSSATAISDLRNASSLAAVLKYAEYPCSITSSSYRYTSAQKAPLDGSLWK
jgi:hypothetical protein